VPDYGGKNESFQVAILQPPSALVYRSQRGHMQVSWSITLTVLPDSGVDAQPLTRIHLRLRLGSVRRKWLVNTAGELLDILTIAVMAAGLRERGDWPPVEGWSVRTGARAGACDAGSPGVAEMIVSDTRLVRFETQHEGAGPRPDKASWICDGTQ